MCEEVAHDDYVVVVEVVALGSEGGDRRIGGSDLGSKQ